MKLSAKEIEAVLQLPGPERYRYLVKRVADQNCAWSLYDEGWALANSDSEHSAFPLWPATEYAALCVDGPWSKYVPKKIEMEDLLEGLLPSLRERSTSLCLFLTPRDKGVVVEADQFEADLREELAQIE